jgi:hypothetical protein
MKIDNRVLRMGSLAILLGMCGAKAFGVPISVTTVGTYAASPTAGMTINDATSNTAANGITLANFKTLMTTAFAAQTGGLIDGEDQTAGGTINPQLWRNNNTNYGDGAANLITAIYGSAQSGSIGLYRTDIDPATSLPVAINGNNNNTFVASGTSYIGVQGPGSPINLAFTRGLADIGLTVVPRGAGRTVTMTAILSDASTITGSSQALTADNTSGAFFWGFSAPGGKSIVGLNITSPEGFSRFDDLGFVVNVPEPGSMLLMSLGCMGAIPLRKRISAKR